MTTPLQKYLDATFTSYAEFAEKVSTSRQNIRSIAQGDSLPSLALAKVISDVTGIPRLNLLYPDENDGEPQT